MEIIRRNIEIRAAEDSRLIEGTAVIYESWSRDLGGFKEIIHSGAISQELLDNSDVIANINHNAELMVARWKRGTGTLNLELKEDGLHFSYEAPETERGNQLLWDIRHGNITECSFNFSLPNNNTCQRWYRDEDRTLRREIFEIGGLYDVSVVNVAAYPETSVANREQIDVEAIKRSLDEAEAEERKKEVEQKEQERKDEIIGIIDIRLKDFLGSINI